MLSQIIGLYSIKRRLHCQPKQLRTVKTIIIVEKFSHTQGNNGSIVDHIKVNGGPHIWFDLDFNGDSTEELIWNFVSGFDINGAR